MIKRKGYRALSNYPVKVVGERVVCLNCNNPIPKRFKKYCSHECASDFWAKNSHQRMREKLIVKFDYACQRCGFQNTKGAYAGLVLDHIKPISLGGEEFNEGNLQILCEPCNKEKTKGDANLIAQQRRIEKLKMGNKELNIVLGGGGE